MSTPHTSPFPSPMDVLRTVWVYRKRVIIPAIAFAVLAGVYAWFSPEIWRVQQAFTLRNEASLGIDGPGKFRHEDAMKVTQDTILELIKSQGVVTAALKDIGPPKGYRNPQTWPTGDDLDLAREGIKLVAPKGAEFGKTEVFYLQVEQQGRHRSIALTEALTQELMNSFQQLRYKRAESMIDELARSTEVARQDREEVTQKLHLLEEHVGADLAELRSLHGSPSSQSELRQRIVGLENELRTTELSQTTNEELLQILQEAQRNPQKLIATPNRLLESQPSLRRLKDGLVDAQLESSKLLGQMSESHPKVRSARGAEREIIAHIHDELAQAISSVELDLKLSQATINKLRAEIDSTQDRLARLASLRAEYSNLVTDVDHRTKLVSESERNLAEARASMATANTTNLINRLGEPEVSTYPVGPGKSMLVAAGFVAGGLTGLGILFLTVPHIVPATGTPGVWGEDRYERYRPLPTDTPAPAPSTSTTPLKETVARATTVGEP